MLAPELSIRSTCSLLPILDKAAPSVRQLEIKCVCIVFMKATENGSHVRRIWEIRILLLLQKPWSLRHFLSLVRFLVLHPSSWKVQQVDGGDDPKHYLPLLDFVAMVLDLLADHQTKVVHLQDVRQLAQWGCRNDLFELLVNNFVDLILKAEPSGEQGLQHVPKSDPQDYPQLTDYRCLVRALLSKDLSSVFTGDLWQHCQQGRQTHFLNSELLPPWLLQPQCSFSMKPFDSTHLVLRNLEM